jgi:hypothetical protein
MFSEKTLLFAVFLDMSFIEYYSLLPDMFFGIQFFVGIGLVLVLLSFEKSTNTNTIPAFGMLFFIFVGCKHASSIFHASWVRG